jgi:hypothetical protein
MSIDYDLLTQMLSGRTCWCADLNNDGRDDVLLAEPLVTRDKFIFSHLNEKLLFRQMIALRKTKNMRILLPGSLTRMETGIQICMLVPEEMIKNLNQNY